MLEAWPKADAQLRDAEAEYALDQVQKAVAGIRDLRTRLNIPPSQALKAVIHSKNAKVIGIMKEFEREMMKLGRLETVEILSDFKKSKTVAGNSFPDFEVFVYLEGVVDFDKERVRIEKKIQETLRYVQTQKTKLSNDNFVKNAPADVVQSERDKLADAEKVLKANQELLAIFQ